MSVTVRVATLADAPLILEFIRELAEYERLLHEVEATEADIRRDLFGDTAAGGNSPTGSTAYGSTVAILPTFQNKHAKCSTIPDCGK
mgnify:CR=1 FL=1